MRGRRTGIVERAQIVPLTVKETWEFFADAGNLEAITPAWLSFSIVTPGPIEMGEGAIIDYRLRLRGVPLRWRTRIDVWEPGVRFVDRQLSGPFALWLHTHTFAACPEGTLIHDRVEYRVPLGPLGAIAQAVLVDRDVDRIFSHRRDAVARLLGAVV